MSSFNLANRLKPAKKAWKSFTIHLKSNFHNFNISKTIKTTKKQFISTLLIIRSLIPRKIFDLTTRSRRRCRYHLSHPHHCHQPLMMKSFKTVYIAEIFSNNNSFEQPKNMAKETSSVASSSSTSLQKEHVYVTSKQFKFIGNESGDTSKLMAHDDDDNDGLLKLSLLSKFRGIDERAEEFISKFKEDMKLEKEKSIIDYEEMLARSV